MYITSHRRQRRTEPRPQVICIKSWWSSTVWFSSYAITQTSRHTHDNTSQPSRWEVTIIGEGEKRKKLSYTNELHERLLKKDGERFWKCWHPKFDSINYTVLVRPPNSLDCCERELCVLDMVINIKNSCCFRIGLRCLFRFFFGAENDLWWFRPVSLCLYYHGE